MGANNQHNREAGDNICDLAAQRWRTEDELRRLKSEIEAAPIAARASLESVLADVEFRLSQILYALERAHRKR